MRTGHGTRGRCFEAAQDAESDVRGSCGVFQLSEEECAKTFGFNAQGFYRLDVTETGTVKGRGRSVTLEYRKFGRSDLEVSAVSLGCMWVPEIDVLHTAFDCGINFFDTAEMYDDRSEELLGKAFSGMREKVIIASKVNPEHLGAEDLRSACEASLRRLETDYIDVYYIHWPNPEIPISETVETLASLRKEGKIRVIACSNFGRQDLTELLQCRRVEANELPYSLLWRAIEYEILEMCVRNEIGVTCYAPLAQGLLTGEYRSADEVPAGQRMSRFYSGDRPGVVHDGPGVEKETFETIEKIRKICLEMGLSMPQVAITWLLRRPGVASVIVGARSPHEVRVDAEAASLDVPSEILDQLTGVTEGLKDTLGEQADMWLSRIR
jgi:myo-inositol catabolism protein IolS